MKPKPGSLDALARHPTLGAQVYEAVKGSIVSGELRPGSQHTEAGLARLLGISRAPLREALRQLQEEGFVEESGRTGFAVTLVTRATIADLYEVRFSLEGRAARNAFGRIPAREAAAMREAFEALSPGLEEGDPHLQLELEFPFHDLWVRNSGNDLLIRHVNRLRDHVLRAAHFAEMPREHRVASHQEHVLILDAIDHGEAGELQQRVEQHIEQVARRIIAHVTYLNPAGEPVSSRHPALRDLSGENPVGAASLHWPTGGVD